MMYVSGARSARTCGPVAPVAQGRDRCCVLADEAERVVAEVLDVQPQHHHVARAVAPPDDSRIGASSARDAPRGPEVQHHHPAAQALQRAVSPTADDGPRHQHRKLEVRGLGPAAGLERVVDAGADVAVGQPDASRRDHAQRRSTPRRRRRACGRGPGAGLGFGRGIRGRLGHDRADRSAAAPAPARGAPVRDGMVRNGQECGRTRPAAVAVAHHGRPDPVAALRERDVRHDPAAHEPEAARARPSMRSRTRSADTQVVARQRDTDRTRPRVSTNARRPRDRVAQQRSSGAGCAS